MIIDFLFFDDGIAAAAVDKLQDQAASEPHGSTISGL